MKDTTHRPSLRLWPAILVTGLLLVAVTFLWMGTDLIRQMKFQLSAILVFLTAVFLLFWLSFFARLSGRARLWMWAGLVVLAAGFLSLFRYRGITGDFVPLFELRASLEPEASSPRPSEASLTEHASFYAARYPQFLGPGRDATLGGIELQRDWGARPPRELWRRQVGEGWSGFAVADGLAVTHEQAHGRERVVAYELPTGETAWMWEDDVGYESAIAGSGPRATPTLAHGRVYTLGATGVLNCLDLKTGERIWSRDVLAENQATAPQWGLSSSPLVLDDLVIVSAGGANGHSLVAYDRLDGETAWHGGSDRASYSSPLLTTLAGRPQIVILNHGSLAAHDPADGRLLWSHPWPSQNPSVTQPVPLPGDRVLTSAGYGIGAKLFQIRRGTDGGLNAEIVWESQHLKAKFTNLVVHDGFIYGLDDGILICLDPETGRRRWKAGRYGHGQVILVGGLLLVQSEKGEIVLVEPVPEELRELGRFKVMEGKVWNPPALAGPYLLVRNDREAALFELPLAEV